ncbi:hypothetical protein BCR44DRAFT_1424029, partial [Catenaria anguillulae PL171]
MSSPPSPKTSSRPMPKRPSKKTPLPRLISRPPTRRAELASETTSSTCPRLPPMAASSVICLPRAPHRGCRPRPLWWFRPGPPPSSPQQPLVASRPPGSLGRDPPPPCAHCPPSSRCF